jgi:hypothetical protein
LLASADIGLMCASTQTVIDVTGKKGIHTHHREDRMVIETFQPGAETDVQIVLIAGLLQQRADPFADADIAALGRTANPLGKFERDMDLERFWPCHARTPCDEEPGPHCERREKN